uniref:PID domain-containing protein n=1 Tax=Stomoxys calcitrans TaxID=35570 RepID=A0A1I8PBV7_STOCA
MEATTGTPQANGVLSNSHDEVDFVKVQKHNFNNNNNNNINESNSFINLKSELPVPKSQNAKVPKERLSLFSFSKKSPTKSSLEEKPAVEASDKNLSCQLTTTTTPVPIGTPPRHKKFVKSSSLSRLLGNTYNAKKFEREEKKIIEGKFNTFGGRRRSSGPYLERFKRYAKEEGDEVNSPTSPTATPVFAVRNKSEDKSKGDTLDRHLMALENFQERHNQDLGSKAMRTISRGLGKLWWKRTHSIDISTPDPEFKVSYLGNVLTGWAKGEGCVEKQLNTLWRNYTQNNKPDVIMRLKVCASGLKATTRQHGLTEYWANRITHCCAPKNYPRVFCWIYRHEGRKLKHELRCHAVLCSKEKQVQEICDTLKANLECALREFKREKILKQNARLSLANAVYDNPSLPRRKILLSVGSNNYRPPLERSKSAPKLMAIEEAIGEEGEEAEETNEPEMKPCCQKDSLYPAMTLGRRRCRRGHSIRRTGQARPVSFNVTSSCSANQQQPCCNSSNSCQDKQIPQTIQSANAKNDDGSDDSDDFEKILKHNNYDSNASLANELMPYFDSQMHMNSNNSCSLSDLRGVVLLSPEDGEPLSLLATINIDPNADPKNDFNLNQTDNAHDLDSQRVPEDNLGVTLRRSGVCSDGEEDFLGEEEEDMYFRQAAILNMLHRHSMRKMANLSLSSDEGSSSLETNSGLRDSDDHGSTRYKHQQQSSISSDASSVSCTLNSHQSVSESSAASKRSISNDSADEGSISSGCETASTVTQNQDDLSLQYHHHHHQTHPHALPHDLEISSLDSTAFTTEDLYKHLQSRNNSDAATTFSSSSSITLKMDSSPTNSMKDLDVARESESPNVSAGTNVNRPRRTRRQRDVKPDSDSECSDESGYVEYQERGEKSNKTKLEQPKPQVPIKPQVPPKPMPRRFISTQSKTTTIV